MSPRSLVLPFAAVAALVAGPVEACFVHAPQPVQVWLDHVRIDVVNGVATKSYECAFKNPNGGEIVGGECYMELEPGAQIDGLSVSVDGRERTAEILSVEEANKVFTEIVTKGGSPALLEYYGNQLIRTKLPRVPAGQVVTVRLRYTMPLKKAGDLYRLSCLNTNPKSLAQTLKAASVTV
ncbi:MAG TPA: VIT domain-containing protein, partial [Planctomycetaceae bacterium]